MASKSPERSRLWKEAYPDALMAREEALLWRHPRDGKDASHHLHANGRSCERHARVGVALSGGGIRSATFGFGVLQAWAKIKEGENPEEPDKPENPEKPDDPEEPEEPEEPEKPEEREKPKALANIDVLSTVSGGGYIGSLISRLFARHEVKDTDDVARAILPARDSEDTEGSEPKDPERHIPSGAVLRWLRDNGRYIAPNGSGDLLLAGAIIVRNWLSIHVVLTTLVLAVFVGMQVVRNALHFLIPDGPDRVLHMCGARIWSNGFPPFASLEAWLTCQLPLGEAYLWWSPWLILPALVFIAAVVPFGWAYWLSADHDKQTSCPTLIYPLLGWFLIFLMALFVMLTSILVVFFKDALWSTEFFAGAPWITDAPEGIISGAAVSVAAIITFVIFLCVKHVPRIQDASGHLDDSGPRNWLSSKLRTSLVCFGVVLALAVIDTLGQTAYTMWQDPDFSLGGLLGTLLGSLVAAAAGGRRVAAYFSGKAGGSRLRPTLNHAATIAAVLLLFITLTAINALSHGIAWGFKHPRYVPEKLVAPTVASVEESVAGIWTRMKDSNSSVSNVSPRMGKLSTQTCVQGISPCLDPADFKELRFQCADCTERGERVHWGTAAALVFLVALSWLFGRTGPFLNNSTLLPLYTARLVRAYLGASNPKRIVTGEDGSRSPPRAVTRVVKSDDMKIEEQWWSIDTGCNENGAPRDDSFSKGAPLHLVNVTINESLDGKSRVQQNDRRGIGMAVGPAGISAGIRHHVVISESIRSEVEPTVIVFPEVPTSDVSEDDRSVDSPFRMFEYHTVQSSPGERRARYRGKHLTLGQWTGISGAAFSTGIGSRTSLGLSFIAGFFNVRLGFWWDSRVDPKVRGRAARSVLGKWFTHVLPVQSYLLDEFFARFHGTARQRWYLSDGGHFENLGAYELIRRRLPLIVIIDAGADPDYIHGDLGNLIRKARIDFDAEIKFLDHEALRKLRALPEGERLEDLKYFGTLEMLRRGPWDEEPIPSVDGIAPSTRLVFGPPDRPRRSLAHAALARVSYEDQSTPDSLIVYVKPTLIGAEPPDITHYQTANEDFPHQTTADQFFDEAQWESYRKLGQLIAQRVFSKGFAPYLHLRDNWPLPGNGDSTG